MKRILPISLFGVLSLAGTQSSLAQTQSGNYRIQGFLCDSTTHEAEAFATVRLLNPTTGKPLRVGTTKTDGTFDISHNQPGKYVLELFATGLQTVKRPIELTVANPVIHTDTIFIGAFNQTLGAATVTAQRPLIKAEIDKLTYSMQDDPDAQTNNLLDMLRKVPMVTVDGDDNIKVNGKSGFKVYVDGKPNSMMTANPSLIFKAYPASSIQKIEVITNPGAKYDAEGVAGVLNIITNAKTQTSGYMVNPSVQVGNRHIGGSVLGMVQVGKLTLSTHYGAGYNTMPDTRQKGEREIYNEAVNHLFTTDGTNKGHGIFQFGSLEAGYEITDKDLISISAGLHGWNGKNNGQTLNQMWDKDGGLVYGYGSFIRYRSKFLGTHASADYQHSFTEDTKLTFSYNYDIHADVFKQTTCNRDLVNLPDYLTLRDLSTDPDNRSSEHTGQVDFTSKWKDMHTLAIGLKYINRLNRSNNKEYARTAGSDGDYTLDEARSLRYRHTGDIAAAYAEYTLAVNDFSFQTGHRYEYYYAHVSYPDGKCPAYGTHFHTWVPSVNLSYNIKPTMMLKTGYNLRIGRPDISYLSPYDTSTNPETKDYGNPNLDYEKSHNFSLSFSSFTPKLNVNLDLSYSFSNNGMVEYSFIDSEGIHNSTYANFQHSQETALSAYINWTIVKGTRLNINTTGTYADYKAKEINSHRHGFSINLWGGVQQDLPWALKANLGVFGSTPSYSLQGKGDSYYFYNLSLSRSFLKEDRLTISISTSNFLNKYRTFKNTQLTDTFRQYNSSRMNSMRFGLGIRWKIGSLKTTVKKVDRSISNDDVMSSGSGSQVGGNSQGGGM